MSLPLKTSVLLTCLLLGACASTSAPPPELVEARSALGSAQRDPAVQSNAPLELRAASSAAWSSTIRSGPALTPDLTGADCVLTTMVSS